MPASLTSERSAQQTAGTPRDAVLLVEEKDGIATLTLNRPARFNVLSDEMLGALQREFDRLAADPSLRCVVLAAKGRAFCAGHDLKEMRLHDDETLHRALFDRCSRMMLTIRALPVPVIAAVQGIATAAGCQLVATCDLAIAGASARFAVSGIDVGLFCSTPAVALSRAIQPKAAFDLLMTGRFIDAETARREGLINTVVEDDRLEETARAYAAEISAKSPAAVRLGKAVFYKQAAMDLADAYSCAAEAMAGNMTEADALAGIDAFLGRRPAAA